uniref:Protein TIC 22, chloroplastic n=1 Tax=Chenopodium quinoa TaxID=63459 RepID=A0A803MX80_CHEQI
MDSPTPTTGGHTTNPLLSLSTFIHRLGADLTTRLDDTRRLAGTLLSTLSPPTPRARTTSLPSLSLPFASVGQAKPLQNAALSSDNVAKSLVGTSVFTVSNTNNEFVLISDPNNGTKSIGLLCFRKEDAEAFLAQVYMLKVEGISFRFLPDPVQIKNALELKASETKSGFDGVPVFQSDLLVVKKKNKRYCPIYFRKEDIEKELSLRASRGRGPQNILISEKNSGWDDLIFIPPGKSHLQHIQEVAKA